MAEDTATTTPGAESEGTSTASSEQDTGGQEPTTYSEEDVAGLKSALEKEKERRRSLQAKVKEAEEATKATMTEQERAVEEARLDGIRKGHAALARAEVITAAVDAGFADPKDAPVFLTEALADLVDGEGEVDTAAVQAAVKDLAKRKPHLLRSAEESKPKRRVGADTTGNAKVTDDPVDQWNQQLRSSLAR